MRDLETAGRAVVEHPAFAPTPMTAIQSGARRRRHQRASIGAAVATVVVVALVATTLALTRHSSARVAVSTGPGPLSAASITDPQLRAHLGLDVPKGWVPVDYGDARLWVPPTWTVLDGGCPGSAPGWVELGGPYKEKCSSAAGGRAPATFVTLRSGANLHGTASARVIHGYQVFAGAAGTFAIPALHVDIEATGPDAAPVVATLAPSSRHVALTYRGPSPVAMTSIPFAGITLSVPAGWANLNNPLLCDDVVHDTVAYGSDPVAHGCTDEPAFRSGPGADGLLLSPPEFFSDHPASVLDISNGPVQMGLRGDGVRSLDLSVILDHEHAVPLRLGLGRDGRVAAAVFRSIRIATTAPSSTTTSTIAAGSATPAITGTWQPLSIAGYSGPLAATAFASPPAVTFDTAGHFVASDGCNDTSASYLVGPGSAFRILGSAVTTQVACVPPSGTVPTYDVLRTATTVDRAGATLRFLDGTGAILATFREVVSSGSPSTTAPDILGPWRPVAIAGYSGPLAAAAFAGPAFVIFEPATWTGSDGCNSIGGRYDISAGNAFATSDNGSTLVKCHANVPLTQVMMSARRVERAGDTLTLLDKDGNVLATFTAFPKTWSAPGPTTTLGS